MGTTNVECERLLTDADFKKIRKLKKRALEEKQLALEEKEGGPSIHMPSFNFMEEREKLKKLTHEMNTRMDKEADYDGTEEADDEGEIIEGSDFEGDEEEFEEGDEEGMDEEEIIEEGDMMFEDGEEEDGDEEEGDEEDSENEVVVKGKKIEKKPIDKKKRGEIVEEEEESSSDLSESEEPFADPRTSFLSTSNIYDPDKNKRRKNLEEIKRGKRENREEHLKKKLGTKIKERGRLTNQQKKKNNPFQMFIQKKRLENRLKDLKSANKRTNKKLHKGQRPRSLGKTFGRK